jgi:hypothetical protein
MLLIVAIVICVSIVQGKMAPYFFIHSPAAKLAYAPKTGRVVDIATGVGIADVRRPPALSSSRL